MRKRINLNAVCSSENYEQSKRVHKKFIHTAHENNSEYIATIKVVTQKKYYVRCFDKLIEITKEEAISYSSTFTVIEL